MSESGRERWIYEDIVDMPHHVSSVHPPMPPEKRAAQFAPFAALTGYEDIVAESARLTDDMIELSEGAVEEMNRVLAEAFERNKTVRITYFVPDERKSGGKYCTVEDCIRRVSRGVIVLSGGERIPAERVAGIVMV